MTAFQDDFFPIPDKKRDEYRSLVAKGVATMKTKQVVICGLARDIADHVTATVQRIEQLGRMFKDFRVVIYENDSKDATRLALDGYLWRTRTTEHVTVLGHDINAPVNPGIRCLKRAERMAYYRNEVRNHIAKNFVGWADNIILVDMDLPGGWSNKGVAHTFGHYGTWDFVGSNGILFRDYALEKMKTVYFDVWAFRWRGSDKPTRPEDINPRYWPNGTELVPVNSCFGGLGVYRVEAFTRCSYDGTDCEHVPFHRRMREAGMGRLFMNPSQLTHYGGEPCGG